jgi:diguanylate cyclase (GGDEF)-like protein/PAS domain S-box-containing protein
VLGSGWVLAAAYILTGKLSLALALPPGYASAIFPPAGIAVAAAFISGRRTWPWIFLGSALLNLWVGYSPAHPVAVAGVAAAVTIALASVLQAALGGWCLRRFVGYPTSFDHAGEVLKFLLLAPAICLVSATLSVGGLTALGALDAASVAVNWLTWWIGDTLGVIVLLPMILVIAGEPRELWRSKTLTVAVPMLVTLALVVFAFVNTSKWEYQESLVEFESDSQLFSDLIQSRFEEQELLLKQIVGFLSNDPARPVSRERFRRFVDAFKDRMPMVRAIEWAPWVSGAQRARFESGLRAEFPDFRIRELDATGRLTAAGDRPDYYPVVYVEPFEVNRPIVGFDLASTADRRSTLSKTAETGLPIASPPLKLAQEKERQSGILLTLRVNEGGNAPGVALTVLRVGDFVEQLLPAGRSAMQVVLIDVASQQRIFGVEEDVHSAEEGARSGPGFERTLTYGTRAYRLLTQPSATYMASHRGWKSWTFLVVGLFASGVLGALLLLGTGSIHRREAEERLALSLVGSDLALTDWDARNDRLVLGSGWTNLLGYEPDEIAFDSSALAALIHPDDVGAARSALIRHLKGETPQLESEVRMRHKDGRWVWVLARGMAVERTADGRALRVTGTGKDVSERKATEIELVRLATTDALTGVANRRCFLEQLETEAARVRRFSEAASLMMIDIDRFKSINDTRGHAVGDAVLRHFADVCRGCLRRVDLFGRLGGEEFGIVLIGTDGAGARQFAERLRRLLAETPARAAEESVAFTVSIGVTQIDAADATPDSILGRADVAMYRAKGAGRNRVEFA